MRSFRLFRSAPPRPSPAPVEVETDAAGLMAFSSEAAPAPGADPSPVSGPASVAAPSAGTATASGDSRARAAIGGLAVLVVLQAVPAGLWVKNRFAPAAGVASAAMLPLTPEPPLFAAATPCAPAVDATVIEALESPPPTATSAPAPAAPPAMVAGLISVSTPVPMRVYLRGRLVGTTEAETIMLPVGTHELSLENLTVGYQVRRTVTVQAGRTTSVELDVPTGTVHVNAVPWAEVFIDGRRVGETPIGNLQLSVGQHDVVFRHPELGERRSTVLVTLKAPSRVSMDMRAK